MPIDLLKVFSPLEGNFWENETGHRPPTSYKIFIFIKGVRQKIIGFLTLKPQMTPRIVNILPSVTLGGN